MCGRYSQRAEYRDVLKHFDVIDSSTFSYQPKPEIFPSDDILIINGARQPEIAHWTIADKDNKGIPRKVINAKSETVHFVNMFRDAFRNGRCLIPATSFFEWKGVKGAKQRYEFTLDEPIFALAGIVRSCEIKGETRACAVILTTEPNELAATVHNRMPVILDKRSYGTWLDKESSFEDLRRLMRPFPSEKMRVTAV